MKTQTIAGHTLELTEGHRYLATRPMASRGRKTYPISINDITYTGPNNLDHTVATIKGLDYDGANEFLVAFNNGSISFDGRMW